MDNMVERAARAAYGKWREALGTGAFPSWEVIPPTTREMYVSTQRAAIEAMRDVDSGSPEILAAGKQSLYSCSEDPELEDARGCWHKMIDAMLAEFSGLSGKPPSMTGK